MLTFFPFLGRKTSFFRDKVLYIFNILILDSLFNYYTKFRAPLLLDLDKIIYFVILLIRIVLLKKEECIIQKIEPLDLVERCPECGSSNLVRDYDTNETICTKCGLVIKEKGIDRGPEWRAVTLEEKKKRSRVGPPTQITIHDKGLSTKISSDNRDYLGRKLTPEMKFQMYRLRKWQVYSRVNNPEERNLAQAMTELHRVADNLNLTTSVRNCAAYIYRKALKERFVRGREINGVMAATIYAACRKMEIPIKLKDIANTSLVKARIVARYYRFLIRKIDISMPIADPLAFISKIAEKIGISGPTQGKAVRIFHQARKKRLVVGKSPLGIAAAVLYIACLLKNEKKTQKEIAEAAGVTEVTVRNRYKDLNKGLKLSVEPSATPKEVISESPVLKVRINRIYETILEIAEKAGISKKTQELAEDIFYQAKEKHVFTCKRRRVKAFAGAILYIACQQTGELKRQKEIAAVAGIPHGTISNYCCYLRWKLKFLKPGIGKYKRAD
jgi:transcription initiation factor TFIIB